MLLVCSNQVPNQTVYMYISPGAYVVKMGSREHEC